MKPSEVKKKLDAIRAQQDINRFQSELNRARSVTIGTALVELLSLVFVLMVDKQFGA